MNYDFELKLQKGQEGIGYYEEYDVKGKNINKFIARVNMYYLPLFADDVKDNVEKKIVNVIIQWDVKARDITDCVFNDLNEDIGNIIKTNDKIFFGRSNKNINYFLLISYALDDNGELVYMTHGDYAIDDKDLI